MRKTFSVTLALVLSSFLPTLLQAAPTNLLDLHNQIRRVLAQSVLDVRKSTVPNNQTLAKQYRSTLFKRFLRYIEYNSQSSYTEEITPGQIKMAKDLYKEIVDMGYKNAQLTDHYYIFVRIPSNLPKDQKAPILGLTGHFDVTPDVTTDNVKANVIKNYQGGKIELGLNPQGEKQVLDPDTPRDAYLKTQIGKTIVTSDGSTNLGADDRAGLSILMTLMETLAAHPEKPHGEIQIVLAPNEETGGAADYIALVPYRPEIAFDFDGSVDGELMTDNFNALQILVTVKGHEGHQSNADGPYVNHGLAAGDLIRQVYEDPSIPRRFAHNSIVDANSQTGHWLRLPSESRGKQGYMDVFINRPSNDVTVADFRARSFKQADLDEIADFIREISDSLAKKYPKIEFSIETKSTYNNVGETAHPASFEVSRKAFEAAGVKMRPVSERAGTTGAVFAAATKNDPEKIVGSYMLFTGQNNMHSYTEWLSEEDMYKSFLVGLNIIDQVILLEAEK